MPQVKVTGFEVFGCFWNCFQSPHHPFSTNNKETIQHNTTDKITSQHHPKGSEWLIRDADPTSFRVQTPELEDAGRFHVGFDHSNMFTIFLKTLNAKCIYLHLPSIFAPQTPREMKGFLL